jgi:hypothetical protein
LPAADLPSGQSERRGQVVLGTAQAALRRLTGGGDFRCRWQGPQSRPRRPLQVDRHIRPACLEIAAHSPLRQRQCMGRNARRRWRVRKRPRMEKVTRGEPAFQLATVKSTISRDGGYLGNGPGTASEGRQAERRQTSVKLTVAGRDASGRCRPEAEISESIRLPSVLPKRHRFARR